MASKILAALIHWSRGNISPTGLKGWLLYYTREADDLYLHFSDEEILDYIISSVKRKGYCNGDLWIAVATVCNLSRKEMFDSQSLFI